VRVTIGHREEAGGITGQRRTYFVDCTVEFSEEERAIIRARDLYGHDIVVRAATPLPSQAAFIGTGFMRSVGWLLLIGGPIVGIVSGFAHTAGETPGFLMFFGGIALVIFGRRRANRQETRLMQPEQSVRVRDLLSNVHFTVHAIDPAYAKAVDADIRAKLVELKDLIRGSAELQSARTFEL
jgi:hypothetical protein